MAEALLSHLAPSFVHATGLLHVASVVALDDGALAPIRIQANSPASTTDQTLLQLVRARADVIITTGRILRDEPDLDPRLSPALEAWRRDVLGKPSPPAWAVLTSGRGFPSQHRIFAGDVPVRVFTSESAAVDLADADFAVTPQFVGDRSPSLRATIRWLREHDAATLSVEAGPSTSADLYAEPCAVDELILSTFLGTLPTDLHAGRLPSLAEITRCLPRLDPPFEVEESSGRWRFQRFRRD